MAAVQKFAIEVLHMAEGKLRAERRGGEVLKAMQKNPGGRSTATTLGEVGLNHNQSSRWQRIASIPADDFEAHHLATLNALPPVGPNLAGMSARRHRGSISLFGSESDMNEATSVPDRGPEG